MRLRFLKQSLCYLRSPLTWGSRLNRSITSGDRVMGMLPHFPLKTARERQPARSPHYVVAHHICTTRSSFGTLHIEWPSTFVPFIIFLIKDSRFFS